MVEAVKLFPLVCVAVRFPTPTGLQISQMSCRPSSEGHQSVQLDRT